MTATLTHTLPAGTSAWDFAEAEAASMEEIVSIKCRACGGRHASNHEVRRCFAAKRHEDDGPVRVGRRGNR